LSRARAGACGMTRLHLLLWFASAVDTMRGIACICDPSSLDCTALWPLRHLNHVLAGVLAVMGAAATVWWLGLSSPRTGRAAWALIPQFIVYCLGAWSSLKAISLGHYADGVVVPPAHIFADQIGWILLPVFYLGAAVAESRAVRGI
jgi:hypothetical protein